jgi:hypothetical protein
VGIPAPGTSFGKAAIVGLLQRQVESADPAVAVAP